MKRSNGLLMKLILLLLATLTVVTVIAMVWGSIVYFIKSLE